MDSKIQLTDFNCQYFKSLDGYTGLYPPDEISIYYTIKKDNQNAGVVGYIPLKNNPEIGFIQIIIDPKFRHQGLAKLAEELLIKRHNLKTVYATIKKTNNASLKAHLKAGFKKMSEVELKELRRKKFLKADEVRLIKVV